jgi:hypothetical protein
MQRWSVKSTAARHARTHLNLRIEPLRNLLPLDLLRRRDESALWRPLISRKHNGLQHLQALKPSLLSGSITLAQDERVDLGVRAERREGRVWVFVGQRGAEVSFVRDDDGDWLRGVWDCVYAYVGDEVARFVCRFEALECNILATLELHEVLNTACAQLSYKAIGHACHDLPVDDRQRAVLVPPPDIARAEPAVLREYTLVIVQVIALVVAVDDGRATETDFALRWVVRR